MQNKIIDGTLQAQNLRNKIKDEITQLNIKPKLAIVLIGNNPASEIYVKIKSKRAAEVGIEVIVHTFDQSITNSQLLNCIELLNNDISINGILLQMPLPKHIDKNSVLNILALDKDVDGFSPINIGKLYSQIDGFVPCTPLGVMHLIKSVRSDLSGLRATIIGRSSIVGRPVAELLLQQNCTINILHSKSFNIEQDSKQSDIIIAAVGSPKLVKRNFIKPGAIVIDVGISKVESKIIGDVDFDNVIDLVSYITPVPGGVGPMTVAYLLYNTLKAAKLHFMR
jgi:methylenetetrahydrofolate dehydrogenase (NADP+)/methenyltetrahydrofolate cyclohydrolase